MNDKIKNLSYSNLNKELRKRVPKDFADIHNDLEKLIEWNIEHNPKITKVYEKYKKDMVMGIESEANRQGYQSNPKSLRLDVENDRGHVDLVVGHIMTRKLTMAIYGDDVFTRNKNPLMKLVEEFCGVLGRDMEFGGGQSG